MFFNYEMPTKIVMGKNCIADNKELLQAFGKKAYIITGRTSAKRNGSLKDVQEALASCEIEYVVFDEIEENPSLETMERAKDLGVAEGVTFIIGIGGGSPIDAAKGIGVMIRNPHLTADTLIGGELLESLPIVAVPTTAGTGTEVTQYAIATDHKAKTKKNIGHRIFPTLAFMDASYMMEMPADITLNTGVDAFSHLVESYLSKKSNPMSDLFVEEGLRRFGGCIDALLSKFFTYETREDLMFASMLGGIAIAQTGTSLPHGMGYALTYHKGMAHGLANGALYIHYLRCFKDQTKVQRIHQLLGLRSHEELEKILAILCEHKVTLSDEEVAAFTEEMCSNAAKLQNHPEEVGREEIAAIYRRSFKA